jgi:undecaprenyl diphosphate synthase
MPPFLKGSFVMQSNRSSKLHVGIIMDGNGRWATRRQLSRLRGHEAGVEAIRRVVEAAPSKAWER